MAINLLILSAGRRVELINCFKRAKERLEIEGMVVAADCSDLAPALYFADKPVLVPRISEGMGYVDAIISICRQDDIKLVIPTIDTELLLLSEQKEYIEKNCDAKVLVSDNAVIKACRNKINTQEFMEANGFLVPRMLTPKEAMKEDAKYPLFIKPLDGSSSINAFKVNNQKEMATYLELVENPIIQEFIEGKEFTIDVFLDFTGKIISMVPRVRIATRSGEIAKGKIVKDVEIIQDVKRLMETLKPIGHITVQCMKTKRGIEYIEINPRFGGGAPMSIMAGADSCENLYRLLRGESLKYNDNYRENVTFLRFDSSIMLNEELKREEPV